MPPKPVGVIRPTHSYGRFLVKGCTDVVIDVQNIIFQYNGLQLVVLRAYYGSYVIQGCITPPYRSTLIPPSPIIYTLSIKLQLKNKRIFFSVAKKISCLGIQDNKGII